MPSSANITAGLAEVTLVGVGAMTGVASTTASPVSSTSYGTVSYDNADSLTQVGYAMQTQNGDCTMDLTTGNTTQSWRYTTSLGTNCNGSLALAGPGQSTPAYVASYDQLVSSLSPAAWWKLSDASGSTTAVDSSGNGYTGTVNGGVTLGQTGPITGTPSDTAALFDGSAGSSITSTASGSLAPFQNHDSTVVGWINPSNMGNNMWFSTGPAGLDGQLELWDNWNSGSPVVSASVYGDYGTPATVIPASGWSMVAVTYTAATKVLTISANGGATQSGGIANSLNVPNGSMVVIGARGDNAGRWFPGDISQVAVFPTVLTTTQIASLYAAGR
jgi:hypothetical protein